MALWAVGQANPWILLADEAPEAVSLEVYGLRVWFAQGFRILQREGWHRTRRADPDRVSRHWLVLAVATLCVLLYGTRVEDAHQVGCQPWHLRQVRPQFNPKSAAGCASAAHPDLIPGCRL